MPITAINYPYRKPHGIIYGPMQLGLLVEYNVMLCKRTVERESEGVGQASTYTKLAGKLVSTN